MLKLVSPKLEENLTTNYTVISKYETKFSSQWEEFDLRQLEIHF